MLEHDFRHLPVLDDGGKVDGHREPPPRRRRDEDRGRAGLRLSRPEAGSAEQRVAAWSTVTFMRPSRVSGAPVTPDRGRDVPARAVGAAFANTHDLGSFVPRIQPSAKR